MTDLLWTLLSDMLIKCAARASHHEEKDAITATMSDSSQLRPATAAEPKNHPQRHSAQHTFSKSKRTWAWVQTPPQPALGRHIVPAHQLPARAQHLEADIWEETRTAVEVRSRCPEPSRVIDLSWLHCTSVVNEWIDCTRVDCEPSRWE